MVQVLRDLGMVAATIVAVIVLGFALLALTIMVKRGYRPTLDAPILRGVKDLLMRTPLWSSVRLLLADLIRE